MFDITFRQLFSSDTILKKLFKGFSNPDRPLPDIQKKPSLVILNTDSYLGKGQHWCLAFFFNRNECEFFDPLGKRPDEYLFHHFIFQKCDSIKFNQFPVQSSTSVNCGHHCIFFAYHRSRGLLPSEIMLLYSKNDLTFNDRMVYAFVRENYGEKYANDGDLISLENF